MTPDFTASLTPLDAIKLIVPTVIFVAGTTGKVVSWAVKRELNGSASKIKEIHAAVKEASQERKAISDSVHVIDNRLTRVETTIDEWRAQ